MIIGIAGTLGAGKGTVVEYLVERRGFKHFSVREYLWKQVDAQGLPRVRESLGIVANALRAEKSPSYIVEQLYAEASEEGVDAIIESLHTIGEAEYLRTKGAYIFGVDADMRIRYERISKRGTETDLVSYEKFVEDNDREIADTDPARHNIRRVIEIADEVFTNNGTLEELHAQLDRVLERLV